MAMKRAQDQREIELNEQEEIIAKKEEHLQTLIQQLQQKEKALKAIVDRLGRKA